MLAVPFHLRLLGLLRGRKESIQCGQSIVVDFVVFHFFFGLSLRACLPFLLWLCCEISEPVINISVGNLKIWKGLQVSFVFKGAF